MTNEELTELIQRGKSEYMADLWENTKKLLFKKANKFTASYNLTARGYTSEDVEQDCFLILCEAVKAYDSEKPYKLSSYFNYGILNHFNTVLGNRIKSKGLDVLNTARSLNETVPGKEDILLIDTIPDESNVFEKIEDRIYNEELRNTLDEALSQLDKDQSDALKLYYYNQCTKVDVGKALNISYDRVNRNISKGLFNLGRNKQVQKYKNDFISSRAYLGNGYSSFIHNGSTPELLIEMLDLKF